MTIQNKVERAQIQAMVASLTFKFERVGDTTVTGCWAFLPSGFQVGYGESACVDPANYKREDGEKYAKQRCLVNAENKLWELEGYLLSVTGSTSVNSNTVNSVNYVERLKAEYQELITRTQSLAGFLISPRFEELAEEDQQLMDRQYGYMSDYGATLYDRLKRLGEAPIPKELLD